MAATFDAKKARISVPAGFRAVLSGLGAQELIGRRANHAVCIEIWPRPVFDEEVNRRTAGIDRFSREFEKLTRRLVAHAHVLTPDVEGRMVLPRELIDLAELQQEVVFTGRHAFFQLWSAPHWAAVLAADAAEAEAEAA